MPISPKHTKQELLTRPWEELCHERWDRGRPSYRTDEDSPFVGDPVVELIEELTDAMNYCGVAQAQLHSPAALLNPSVAARRMDVLMHVALELECAIHDIQEVYRDDH